jgi:hydroxymethylpyrimidine pyrophosphatase-like HAD family hydrolase
MRGFVIVGDMSLQISAPLYVFDLDGVITDPSNTQVNESVIDEMHRLLIHGRTIAINTGRSFEWVEKQLIYRLSRRHNTSILARLIVSCEKGGELVSWTDGVRSKQSSKFALPREPYEITKSVFDENKSRLTTMFWDVTKLTMATIEKEPNAIITEFHEQQLELSRLLEHKLAEYDVNIDVTTIATDVESTTAGKYAGAEVIWENIISTAGAGPDTVISIGDSISDYDMAVCFADKGSESTFVYVGEHPEKLVQDDAVKFIHTDSHYAAGTLEFLQK